MKTYNRKETLRRLHKRLRKHLAGTTERPRLSVHFSGRHVYAQVIDDQEGKTLAAVCTTGKDLTNARANQATAQQVGKLLAEKSKQKGVTRVVFDRGGHKYQGKVKALADAAREGGLEF